jgi:hypothetical protein
MLEAAKGGAGGSGSKPSLKPSTPLRTSNATKVPLNSEFEGTFGTP